MVNNLHNISFWPTDNYPYIACDPEKATMWTKIGELSDEEVQAILSRRNAGK